jgi:hypothetical protein
MLLGTWKKVLKGIAITQAITAPGLIVLGLATHNKKLATIGVVWSGWIALDSGRTACLGIDNAYKAERHYDNEVVF